MSWLQLDSQSIADRAGAARSTVPTLGVSLARGIVGFTLVSVAGFVPWAVFGRWFRQHLGEAGLYAVCALVFIGLSGPLLHRLIIGPGSLTRFYRLFSVSFAAYSVAWIVGWMALRGSVGSVAGLLAGTALMGWMLATAFDARGAALPVIAALFVLNSLGYFIGGEIEAALIRQHALAAKLLWGVSYGAGFGAGLGLAFHLCQSRARTLLRTETPATAQRGRTADMSDSPPLSRLQFLGAAFLSAGASLAATPGASGADSKDPRQHDFDVRDFGATGDGVTFDTAALQAAIDACALAKGGRVYLPGGTFLTRTIQLRSHVTLYLAAGAVLQGTPKVEEYAEIQPAYRSYTYSHRALIYAEGAENVSILGPGAIDLAGRDFPPQPMPGKGKPGAMEWGSSPFGLRLVQCRDLTLRDVTIRNCPMAALRVEGCAGVLLEGLRIDNRVRISGDGIEIVSCREVCMSNCRVTSWDDAICLKSASADACRNITITNCTVSSLCNAIKLGTESSGGFENIVISNCTIEGGVEEKGERAGWRSINGLALMIVDGGTLDQVSVSHLVMRGVRTAIFVHIGNRARLYAPDQPKPGIGVLRNVSITDIQAEVVDGDYCCSITGEPGHPVENIVLQNIQLRHPGGGSPELAARAVPEKPTSYPESLMFGPLPASGFYCRHVKGLTLRDIKLQHSAADGRPALVCETVEDLEVTGLSAGNIGHEPLVRLHQVSGALLRDCRPRGETFVAVSGEASTDIALLSNDLRQVRTPFTKADNVPGEIRQAGNLEAPRP